MKATGAPDLSGDAAQKEAYSIALKMEKKSYTLYESKASETDDADEKKLLLAIAREERHHFRLIERLIDFISQPDIWLENAEFTHLTEY
jgi:rubrerythrin